MKKITFLLILIIILIKFNYSQQCNTNGNTARTNALLNNVLISNCGDINTYTTLNNNTNAKNIRIALHIFQKNDGFGNIQDTPANRTWLNNYIWAYINQVFNNLNPMSLTTTSPYIADTKIYFQADSIYFWKDSYGWDGRIDNKDSGFIKGNILYTNYVINNPKVANKYTTLHVFMSGFGGKSDGAGSGQASGLSDKRWVMFNSIYQAYLNNTGWNAGGILRHELGHAIGLGHSWYTDYCDDTPTNSNCGSPSTCGSSYTNNVMDYNICNCALTRCQINRLHYFLLGGVDYYNTLWGYLNNDISDCVVNGINVTTPIVSGPLGICNPNGATYNIDNLQLGVTVNATAFPINLFQNANICGGPGIIFKPASTTTSGGAIITFTTGFGKYGTTSFTKKVWVGTRPANLDVCIFNNNPLIYGATIINSPGISCATQSAILPNSQDVTFIAATTNLNGGFEVPLGTSFEVIPEIVACQ